MQRSDEMTPAMLQVTLHRYVCGICWGHLTEITQDSTRYVVCAKDHEHRGFVTARFAERQIQQSKIDKFEVVEMLEKAGVIEKPKTGLTPDYIIKSLGF